MNIAVRVPNWIGDGVMALPAIAALRRFRPGDRLVVVSRASLADIFENLPGIDGIVRLPSRFLSAARLLREQAFDVGLLLTNSFSSALLFRLARIPGISGYDRDGRGLLLHRRIAPPRAWGHHREYYMQLVSLWAGRAADPAPPGRIVLTPAEIESAGRLLAENGLPETGRDLVGIAPAAAYGSAKCWEPARFSAWIEAWRAEQPGSRILLFGSAGERAAVERLAAAASAPAVNLAGRLTLRQSLVLLSRCRLVLANDSGVMHLASALNRPLVALFGATLPQKTGPSSARQEVIFRPAHCTPCRHRECPTDHACMNRIEVEEVLAAARRLWAAAGDG